MAKECLNMVRQDANTLCQQEILKYLESLSSQLGAFKENAEKEIEQQKKMAKLMNQKEQEDVIDEGVDKDAYDS